MEWNRLLAIHESQRVMICDQQEHVGYWHVPMPEVPVIELQGSESPVLVRGRECGPVDIAIFSSDQSYMLAQG